MPDGEKSEVTEISFESRLEGTAAASLKVEGMAGDLLRSPDKVRQLMDLLELPEGTNARVTIVTSSVIVR